MKRNNFSKFSIFVDCSSSHLKGALSRRLTEIHHGTCPMSARLPFMIWLFIHFVSAFLVYFWTTTAKSQFVDLKLILDFSTGSKNNQTSWLEENTAKLYFSSSIFEKLIPNTYLHRAILRYTILFFSSFFSEILFFCHHLVDFK